MLEQPLIHRVFRLAVVEENISKSESSGPSAGAASSKAPSAERSREFVANINGARLVGETALLLGRDSNAIAQMTGTLLPLDPCDHFCALAVTAKEPIRALVWSKRDLQLLFLKAPTLAVGWSGVVSSDLLSRLKEQKK